MSVFVTVFILWILLTGSLDYSEVIVGLIVSIITAFIFSKYAKIRFNSKFIIGLIKFTFVYLPVFIVAMVKANIDVASRVLNPKLPLNPGFIRIKTGLKGEVSKLFLANSITLTPGTLSLDINDDELYIHWIDVKTTKKGEKERIVSGRFERILKGVFE